MAYLTIQELNTPLHDELVETITRGDATIAEAAIDAAIAEAKGYLSRFDCTRIFSASGSKRNQLLLIFVKDIAIWHLINLGNADGIEIPAGPLREGHRLAEGRPAGRRLARPARS